MRLAITGGAGFLGLHLCSNLAPKLEDVLVLDIAPIDPQEYPQNVRYENVDVRDLPRLRKALTGMDAVIHATAALPLWKDADIFSTNVDGTRNTLQAAVDNRIPRVVFVSSTAVYGVPEKHPIYEDDPLVGVGAYGESKIQAEKICAEYRAQGLCVPVVRPKTFIGPARLGVFQILYDWVQCGKHIPMIGNANNRYQLLEVDDLVQAIDLMLTLPNDRVNDVFNVGAVEFGTVRQSLGALCQYAASGSQILPVPSWLVKPVLGLFWRLHVSPLYPWVYATADKDSFVSSEKAQSQLGWKPRYSNAEALIRSYQWYLDHAGEIAHEGVTHRVAWKQGILALVKRFM
jgi:nucleoside-diphosphate-sugar epimerase